MESSPLDFVAQASMDLQDALNDINKDTDKDTLIANHIKKVWSSVLPVDDFKKNLEWVNVSEPLSLSQHCSEKIVVLDFWTYCCINCYHVLPDLDYLENLHKGQNGLVVIGVHCAKFNNEKDSANVLAAVQRYNIHHPVVNDSEHATWSALGIKCWPTLLILGPGNKPIYIITGEGHREQLVSIVGAALKHFGPKLSDTPLPISLTKHLKPSEKENEVLYFPSKISLNPFYRGRAEEPFLAIADSGHHRILLTDCSGIILRIIGSSVAGFKDGKLSTAQFNSPQGLCWLSSNVLAVCDTNNHALRAVHLDDGTVEVLAGTGQQAEFGDQGGKCLGLQPLASPWDVVLFTTPDMDMSVRPPPTLPPVPPLNGEKDKLKDDREEKKEKEKKDEKRRVLIIACAGSHQLWGLFLDTTIWWKYKTYTEGTCACVAGSGAEAARNSAYPHTAAFAQPSGLALRTGTNPEVFIADSESSSIRRLALPTGQVSTLCGGDRNPLNLFAFGDVDDIGIEAKLQHPLAVAYCESTKILYIADTYNHKIKKVDVSTQKVSTLSPTMIETADPVKFNEPSGLSMSPDGKYLYIADTNNHSIKVLNLAKNVCQELRIRLPDPKFIEPENLILYKNDLFVNKKCGNLVIYFNVSLDTDTKTVKFTPGAPQNWHVCIRDDSNRDVTLDDFEFINCTHKGNKLPGRVEMKIKQRTDKTHYRMYLSFTTALCDGAVCFTHSFTIRSTILVRESVKMVESYKITCKVNPVHHRSDKSDSKKDTSLPL
ncbi:NHL repeat-containing protein 2 [Amyelois transitella]|uniref:NHL repeat-containing protein 2 n=1 Tax=Amyelois transitella TaxID=680683 RepID=UPI00067AE73D|nr:NHL repeat-containing protein 2 [Amyelois transitella]